MSHIVTLQVECRDQEAIRAACKRLGLVDPVQGTTKLFSGQATGLAVQLPNWTYPVVCDTATGKAHYDNFNGRWGDQRELDRFLQMYAVEKCRIEARKAGRSVTETPLPNGSIKLCIQLGGAA